MPTRKAKAVPLTGDGPTLFGWDLPVREPELDVIYTCTDCGQHRPAAPVVPTVDPRWWSAPCIDCGKRRIFTVVRRQKGTPSRDSKEHPDGQAPDEG